MAPSRRPSPRTLSARSAWFGLLLLLAPVPGMAQTATLVFPDVCKDPKGVFDYYWAKGKFGAADLFLFKDKNTISPVSAAQAFDTYPTILVIAHGNADSIDTFAKADVANRIKAAHPTTPNTVRFFSCSAAAGSGTVLKLLNGKYNDAVQRLFGSTSTCALTGNGSPDLATAEYRGSPVRPNLELFNAIVANIKNEWATGNYQNTGKNYKESCEAIRDNNLASLPTFMKNVFDYFSTAPVDPDGDPKKSQNYLQLIKLSNNGTAPLECGQATGVCP